MTYDLYIGDRTFSSWSLRGWLMLKSFGIPFQEPFAGALQRNVRDRSRALRARASSSNFENVPGAYGF
jgi:hypothetical protein